MVNLQYILLVLYRQNCTLFCIDYDPEIKTGVFSVIIILFSNFLQIIGESNWIKIVVSVLWIESKSWLECIVPLLLWYMLIPGDNLHLSILWINNHMHKNKSIDSSIRKCTDSIHSSIFNICLVHQSSYSQSQSQEYWVYGAKILWGCDEYG